MHAPGVPLCYLTSLPQVLKTTSSYVILCANTTSDKLPLRNLREGMPRGLAAPPGQMVDWSQLSERIE
jgi:hypothetical protein